MVFFKRDFCDLASGGVGEGSWRGVASKGGSGPARVLGMTRLVRWKLTRVAELGTLAQTNGHQKAN